MFYRLRDKNISGLDKYILSYNMCKILVYIIIMICVCKNFKQCNNYGLQAPVMEIFYFARTVYMLVGCVFIIMAVYIVLKSQ